MRNPHDLGPQFFHEKSPKNEILHGCWPPTFHEKSQKMEIFHGCWPPTLHEKSPKMATLHGWCRQFFHEKSPKLRNLHGHSPQSTLLKHKKKKTRHASPHLDVFFFPEPNLCLGKFDQQLYSFAGSTAISYPYQTADLVMLVQLISLMLGIMQI